MTNLTLVYYDRKTGEKREIEISNDVVEIRVSASEENQLPGLAIHVNTEAVIVNRLQDGAKISQHNFTDLYADAVGDLEDVNSGV